MVELTDEERQKIYEEEKVRAEARERLKREEKARVRAEVTKKIKKDDRESQIRIAFTITLVIIAIIISFWVWRDYHIKSEYGSWKSYREFQESGWIEFLRNE